MIELIPGGLLIDAGGIAGPGWWALCIAALVFVAAGMRALRGSRARGALLVAALVGGVVGAWLADTIMTGRPWPIGLSLFGAALGGPIAVLIVARATNAPVIGSLALLDLLALLDRLAIPSLVAAIVARTGCLFAGCELGLPADHGFVVRYASGTAAFEALVRRGQIGPGAAMTPPLHSLPLYEIALALLALGVVIALRRRLAPGVSALIAGGGWFVARGFAEVWRAPGAGIDQTLPSITPVAGVTLLIGVSLLAAIPLWRMSCRRSSRIGAPPRSLAPLSCPPVPPTNQAM